MQYTTLGGSGLRISRLCLGAMTFGAGTGIWGEIAGLGLDESRMLVATKVRLRTGVGHNVSNQVHYALTCRDVEHEIAPVAKANDVALLVWSPLAGGYLSGKYTQGKGGETGRRTNLNFPPIDPAKADPIVGARTPDQLAANLDAQQIALTAAQTERLQQFHDKDRVLV